MIATLLPGHEIITRRTYQLSADVLRAKDRNGIAFGLHVVYTALGHRHGGTTITDAELAGFFGGVSSETLRRARNVGIDCDALEHQRRGRGSVRRIKRPPRFVHLPGLVVRAFLTGVITAHQLRTLATIVHRLAETGPGAGYAETTAELAGFLGVGQAAAARDVRALAAAGLLYIQTRPGMGRVLIPQHYTAPARAIPPSVRAAIAKRRIRWGLPRAGASSTARTGYQHPPEFCGATPPSFVGPPGAAAPPSPQVRAEIAKRPLERQGFNDKGSPVTAPWDIPGARWEPPPPQPRISRPADLTWRLA